MNNTNNTIQEAQRIGFVSLGCPKALVDSERIITQLRAQGYELVANYENAHLVVVNTCSFIESAIEESLSSIAEALEKNGKVIVTGCLGRKAELIRERFSEDLVITGPHDYEAVMQAVHQHLPPNKNPYTNLIPPEGIKLTPRHYAYLKISEGCNHRCTFCIIPSLRGKLDSRPIGAVLQEAQLLAKAGVKELLIISQDTSAYGVDTKYQADSWQGQSLKTDFNTLCQMLGELGIWVRLHYVYPYPHVDHVIPYMAEGKILPYLDIPFQHASPRILKLMKRPANSENNLERIQAWRKICPDITIRSTFIVGFPGETEAEFDELLDFLEESQLDRVGCFTYSAVTGAKANDLPDPVPEAVKAERYAQLMELQATISKNKLRQKIGKILPVLIDEIQPGQKGKQGVAIGRTQGDAPEIDGIVTIKKIDTTQLKPGAIVNVKITGADEYDLMGQLEDKHPL